MSRRLGVVVVGSANADLVLPVARLPLPGQTVLASGRSTSPGGKGLNQAVAAARAGVRTAFVGALGADAEGDLLRGVLDGEGIEAALRVSDEPTGLAVVLVDSSGENSIVVAGGANTALTDLTQQELAVVAAAEVLLVQLEVPLETVATAARSARAAGARVVFNAAPAQALDDALLSLVDVLVVNEGEARELSEAAQESDLDAVLDRLLERVSDVVVTLGAAGSMHRSRAGRTVHEPGRTVDVVDTTGAGDTYAGYLAAALAAGEPVDAGMRRATTAAALCVTRPGAVPSVPTRADVEAFGTEQASG